MVDDVEGTDVLVLLPEDEEGSVEKLRELGEEVPPGGVGHAEGLGVHGAVHRLAHEGVVEGPAGRQDLVQDPGRENHLWSGAIVPVQAPKSRSSRQTTKT